MSPEWRATSNYETKEHDKLTVIKAISAVAPAILNKDEAFNSFFIKSINDLCETSSRPNHLLGKSQMIVSLGLMKQHWIGPFVAFALQENFFKNVLIEDFYLKMDQGHRYRLLDSDEKFEQLVTEFLKKTASDSVFKLTDPKWQS